MNFEELVDLYNKNPLLPKLVISTLLVLSFFIFKRLWLKRVYRGSLASSKKISTYLNLGFCFFLFVLWFSQIESLLISLFAVAAAIVLALKEIIMCFTGGLIISINNHFKEGDSIEVDGLRGYVISKSMTVTKVLEIGPEKNSQQTTGNIVTIPNSVFLAKSLRNESYFRGYSIKSFLFPAVQHCPIEEQEKQILIWGEEVSSQYIDGAKKFIPPFCKKEGINIPSIDPRIKLSMSEEGDVDLLLKIPVKNSDISLVEQQLLRKYVSYRQSFEKFKTDEKPNNE